MPCSCFQDLVLNAVLPYNAFGVACRAHVSCTWCWTPCFCIARLVLNAVLLFYALGIMPFLRLSPSTLNAVLPFLRRSDLYFGGTSCWAAFAYQFWRETWKPLRVPDQVSAHKVTAVVTRNKLRCWLVGGHHLQLMSRTLQLHSLLLHRRFCLSLAPGVFHSTISQAAEVSTLLPLLPHVCVGWARE